MNENNNIKNLFLRIAPVGTPAQGTTEATQRDIHTMCIIVQNTNNKCIKEKDTHCQHLESITL